VSGPREIIAGLGRRGSASAIVDHLATRGPCSASEISDEFAITPPGARAQLIALRAAGVVELEDANFRLISGIRQYRYYVDPDALRYAARWLDALAERAERANRAAAFAPLPKGRWGLVR
jgi:DNA-binding transcriptional ArsR family regulator